MIYLLRASHANEFELQNYAPIAQDLHINIITSHNPLTPVSMPTTQLWSPTDLPDLLFRRQLLNRLIGGEQWLLGLEKEVVERYNDLNHCIIHTAETYTPYTHQAVELKKAGVIQKLVCTCWETIPHNNEKFARLRKWKAEAYKHIDVFHTPTERAKQALVAEGVDPSKIMVIPYGVDLSRFHPPLQGRRTLKVDHRPLIVTVARLAKEKGIDDVVAVAEELPDYDFLLVGRGTYNPRGSNIKTTSVPYSEIHKIYQKADVFFLPSITTPTWEEQYGMALVEAMACGLPVVTTNSGAIPEVVGDAGITVEEGNVDKMVKTVRSILTSPDMPKKYSALSHDRATKLYDCQKVAQKLKTLYA
jgi:glycosyltransferase involved in cell wall biosynthesis